MVEYELDPFPNFLSQIISSNKGFSQKSSLYNNLVAMAATIVCNYTNSHAFTERGHGPQSVFMNGRVHHYGPEGRSCCVCRTAPAEPSFGKIMQSFCN